MCRPVTCRTCHKITWAGCGQHIGQVRAAVPASNWCNGRHAPAGKAAAGSTGGLLTRLLGR